ncbi:MAG TPA: SDR family oxidoreductase [Vicinamibacteria bacterium]|nr:SDR family oxidoreductase [Vicinamibacteria bacterium]
MPRPDAFAGQVALVTGGTSGIGLELGRQLARRGASVVLAGRRLEVAEAEATAIRGAGGQAEAARLDVTDATAFAAVVQEVTGRHGRLDFLFNNAGVSLAGGARRYTREDWELVLGVNLHGVVNGVQAVYPLMIAQGHGHLVNVASLAGLVPSFGPAYTASKHAVVALSLSLRPEAARFGVRVSVVCPGFVDTPLLFENVAHAERQRLASRQDLPRAFGVKAMPVEKAVSEMLRSVERNRPLIVVTPHAKLLWRLYRLFPLLVARVASSGLRRPRRQP